MSTPRNRGENNDGQIPSAAWHTSSSSSPPAFAACYTPDSESLNQAADGIWPSLFSPLFGLSS
jgi:hypothetical protein